jgi:hypothetical protein
VSGLLWMVYKTPSSSPRRTSAPTSTSSGLIRGSQVRILPDTLLIYLQIVEKSKPQLNFILSIFRTSPRLVTGNHRFDELFDLICRVLFRSVDTHPQPRVAVYVGTDAVQLQKSGLGVLERYSP